MGSKVEFYYLFIFYMIFMFRLFGFRPLFDVDLLHADHVDHGRLRRYFISNRGRADIIDFVHVLRRRFLFLFYRHAHKCTLVHRNSGSSAKEEYCSHE